MRMEQDNTLTAGIDVSKNTLDVAVHGRDGSSEGPTRPKAGR